MSKVLVKVNAAETTGVGFALVNITQDEAARLSKWIDYMKDLGEDDVCSIKLTGRAKWFPYSGSDEWMFNKIGTGRDYCVVTGDDVVVLDNLQALSGYEIGANRVEVTDGSVRWSCVVKYKGNSPLQTDWVDRCVIEDAYRGVDAAV